MALCRADVPSAMLQYRGSGTIALDLETQLLQIDIAPVDRD